MSQDRCYFEKLIPNSKVNKKARLELATQERGYWADVDGVTVLDLLVPLGVPRNVWMSS